MMVDGDFYVYALFRPNGIVCYIGKGKEDRWEQHERWASRQDKNVHLSNIIRAAGGSLPKVKIHKNLTEDVAIAYEVMFIAAIGREHEGGPLVNQTAGGDGVVNANPNSIARMAAGVRAWWAARTDEEREAYKEMRRQYYRDNPDKVYRQWGNQNQLGLKRSAESRAKMSATRKALYENPEFRARMKEAHRGQGNAWATPEVRAKISAAHKGKPKSPETRARMSAAQQRIAAEKRAAKMAAE